VITCTSRSAQIGASAVSSSLPAAPATEQVAQVATMMPVVAQRRRNVSPIRASVWVLDMPLLRKP
jgi:hypothetical protein